VFFSSVLLICGSLGSVPIDNSAIHAGSPVDTGRRVLLVPDSLVRGDNLAQDIEVVRFGILKGLFEGADVPVESYVAELARKHPGKEFRLFTRPEAAGIALLRRRWAELWDDEQKMSDREYSRSLLGRQPAWNDRAISSIRELLVEHLGDLRNAIHLEISNREQRQRVLFVLEILAAKQRRPSPQIVEWKDSLEREGVQLPSWVHAGFDKPPRHPSAGLSVFAGGGPVRQDGPYGRAFEPRGFIEFGMGWFRPNWSWEVGFGRPYFGWNAPVAVGQSNWSPEDDVNPITIDLKVMAFVPFARGWALGGMIGIGFDEISDSTLARSGVGESESVISGQQLSTGLGGQWYSEPHDAGNMFARCLVGRRQALPSADHLMQGGRWFVDFQVGWALSVFGIER